MNSTICLHKTLIKNTDAYMDVGGTTPWMGEVEPRWEQRSRVKHGAETETLRTQSFYGVSRSHASETVNA